MANERGVTLLEVLVAVAILGTVSAGLFAVTAQALASEARARAREEDLQVAEGLLVEHVLLDDTSLNQRLGLRRAGPYVVRVDRPERTLYRIAVASAEAPDQEWLVTVVAHGGRDDAP